MATRTTYLLVDGENIDATLGVSILDRKPEPNERPRWPTLLDFAAKQWQQPAKGLFFLAVPHDLPAAFVQALLAMGYRPVPLSGEGKVVDIAIQRTLDALADRADDVMLVSHDGDFAPQMQALATDGERRVGIVGFREFMAGDLRAQRNIEFFDLEHDVGAFTNRLPRVRIIPIDEFDPLELL